MQTEEQRLARKRNLTAASPRARLHEIDKVLTYKFQGKEVTFMTTILTDADVAGLLAGTRERGVYQGHIDRLLADENASGYDLTADFEGKKVDSVYQGFNQAINSKGYKGKVRCIKNDKRVVLVKCPQAATAAEPTVEAV